MDALAAPRIAGEDDVGRTAARRAAVVRGFAVTYLLVAAGFLLLTVPLAYDRLQQPCVDGPCLTGQLTADGIRDLAATGVAVTAYASYVLILNLGVPLIGLTLALTVVWQRPHDRVALLFAFFFATCPVGFSGIPAVMADRYPEVAWGATLVDVSSLTFWPLFSVFPDGRFVPRWSRWLLVPHAAVALVLLAPTSAAGSRQFEIMEATWFLLYSFAIVGFQVYRYRRAADDAQRRQIRWALAGISAVALSLPLVGAPSAGAAGGAFATTLYTASVLFCMAMLWVALLRHRLFDIDVIVNRALVYGGLTGCVIGIYALVVGLSGAILRGQGSFAASLLGAGIVAVAFRSLRSRLQHGVDRLMYGDRHDPYRALTRLGSRLESTLAPQAVLRGETDMAVVGEAADGDTALARAELLQPDVVLMDLKMPGRNGLEATRGILHTSPHVRVLVLTMADDDESVFAALQAGARGYLLKGALKGDVLRAIRGVAAGDAIFGATVAQRVMHYFATVRPPTGVDAFPELTGREREVLALLAHNRGNQDVADRLGLNVTTVRNHVSNICTKLEVADRTQAMIRARDAGLGRR